MLSAAEVKVPLSWAVPQPEVEAGSVQATEGAAEEARRRVLPRVVDNAPPITVQVAPPVAVRKVVLLSALPPVPPRRAKWKRGLTTGRLKLKVSVPAASCPPPTTLTVVPEGEGVMKLKVFELRLMRGS
ncbi:hypothetical protein [Lysobacter antibioticus]|uniref:hypothetical protein n=1 Tax=Lysobacter antibioticus TaxID=84531 RepID=UPI0004D00570|nr:hypothetical protein [Lysobacter antibioticus]